MQIGIVALRHKSQVLGERTTREARFRLGGGGQERPLGGRHIEPEIWWRGGAV